MRQTVLMKIASWMADGRANKNGKLRINNADSFSKKKWG
jgi:hypothetical protein